MYPRFVKWIFTSHRTTLAWKVPFQKYLWCFWWLGDGTQECQTHCSAWTLTERSSWSVIYVSLSISLISYFFLYHGSPSHLYHKSLAIRDFPQHKHFATFEAALKSAKNMYLNALITKATLARVQILGNILSAGGWWHLLEEPRTGHRDVKSDSESEVTSRSIRWHNKRTHSKARMHTQLKLGNFRA